MAIIVRCLILVLVALMLTYEAFSDEFSRHIKVQPLTDEELAKLAPYMAYEEYIRQMHSMVNSYKTDVLVGRMVIETNALIDTKSKTLKRNADLINSILALPKDMNDAGR